MCIYIYIASLLKIENADTPLFSNSISMLYPKETLTDVNEETLRMHLTILLKLAKTLKTITTKRRNKIEAIQLFINLKQ